MELRQLEIFRVLAEELNFTRTASLVGTVQSNVTTQIRGLEDELGVVLFERLGKQVRLTENGLRLRRYAQQVLNLVEEAKEMVSAREEPAGTLRIGTPESVLAYRLPRVIETMRARYPRIAMEFRTMSCPMLMAEAERGGVDLMTTIVEECEDGRLEWQELCAEEMVLVAQPRSALALRRGVGPKDLAGETLLLTEEDCGYRLKLLRILAAAGVNPESRMTFTSVEAIKQCAANGLGVALLPRITVVAELEAGRLAALRWKGAGLEMRTLIGWHKDKWMSPAMEAFVAVVNEQIGGQLAKGGVAGEGE